jgi:multidrug efflux pump subunit AcrB
LSNLIVWIVLHTIYEVVLKREPVQVEMLYHLVWFFTVPEAVEYSKTKIPHYGALEMNPGASFAETEKATTAVERIMAKHPEIEKVSTEIGAETMFESFSPFYTGYSMPQANAASFMFTLSDKDKRDRDIWQVIDGIQQQALRTIPASAASRSRARWRE